MSGKPRGDEATITRSFRLTPKEWAAIDAEAERRGITRTQLIRAALETGGVLEPMAFRAAS